MNIIFVLSAVALSFWVMIYHYRVARPTGDKTQDNQRRKKGERMLGIVIYILVGWATLFGIIKLILAFYR